MTETLVGRQPYFTAARQILMSRSKTTALARAAAARCRTEFRVKRPLLPIIIAHQPQNVCVGSSKETL
jgi:hypothetical protein